MIFHTLTHRRIPTFLPKFYPTSKRVLVMTLLNRVTNDVIRRHQGLIPTRNFFRTLQRNRKIRPRNERLMLSYRPRTNNGVYHHLPQGPVRRHYLVPKRVRRLQGSRTNLKAERVIYTTGTFRLQSTDDDRPRRRPISPDILRNGRPQNVRAIKRYFRDSLNVHDRERRLPSPTRSPYGVILQRHHETTTTPMSHLRQITKGVQYNDFRLDRRYVYVNLANLQHN